MFDSALSAVICVNTDNQTINFYAHLGGNSCSHLAVRYNSQPFDDVFFQKLDRILQGYRQKNPNVALAKVSLVLPDHIFLTDIVNVPSLGRKATDNSLNLAIDAIYKNTDELKLHTYPMTQNKQTATFGLVGARKDLLQRITDVCAANGVGIQNITFTANAMANGAFALNPKLKNGTFLLLDIKESSARFAFVNKGRTVGRYSLPFGYSMLYKTRFAAEDVLFDHSSGELLVLNAKERARAKQLTITGEEVLQDEDAMDNQDVIEFNAAGEDGELLGSDARATSRGGRKLPKFMLRDAPSDGDGFMYENFRIFMKWTLDLIAGNPDIIAQGPIDTVYVNMPRTLNFLFDMVNAEAEENKVKFAPLIAGASFDSSAAFARDLELFGGFHVRQFNKINNF